MSNRKLFLIPVPTLFYVHEERKILLGNDVNGNLILKEGEFFIWWIVGPTVRKSIDQVQYKKLK